MVSKETQRILGELKKRFHAKKAVFWMPTNRVELTGRTVYERVEIEDAIVYPMSTNTLLLYELKTGVCREITQSLMLEITYFDECSEYLWKLVERITRMSPETSGRDMVR